MARCGAVAQVAAGPGTIGSAGRRASEHVRAWSVAVVGAGRAYGTLLRALVVVRCKRRSGARLLEPLSRRGYPRLASRRSGDGALACDARRGRAILWTPALQHGDL